MATSALAVQNWFETTLSGGINASDTTIGLNSVPTGTEGYLIIEPDGTTTREVIYYTSKTSNSVVLTSAANGRGVDGTTAQSHSAGATVRMQITSGYWNALQDGTALATSAITTGKVADSAITPAKWTNPYKFAAYRNAALSTANGSQITVFDTEEYDTNNNYNTSDGKYTAPVDGYYQFSTAHIISSTGQVFSTSFFVNGTEVKRLHETPVAPTGNITIGGSALVYMTAGQYCQVNVNASAVRGIVVANKAYTYFTGFLVSQT